MKKKLNFYLICLIVYFIFDCDLKSQNPEPMEEAKEEVSSSIEAEKKEEVVKKEEKKVIVPKKDEEQEEKLKKEKKEEVSPPKETEKKEEDVKKEEEKEKPKEETKEEVSPSKETEEKEEDVEEEEKGPDTVEYPEQKIGFQGNWVKKREWMKEAISANDQIQDIVGKIQKSKEMFLDKFIKNGEELDLFYQQEGFEQGKIEELFNELLRYLYKKKKKAVEVAKAMEREGITGEYEIKIDIIEEDIQELKRDLEQLKLDIKSIDEVAKSLSERIKKLDEQIISSLYEGARAEKLIDEMWYIIDDKQARLYFYELNNGILEKVKLIQQYIEKDLMGSFNKALEVIKVQMDKVKNGVKDLENKGLIVKNRSQRLKQIKLEALEKAKADQKIPISEYKKEKEKKEESWQDKIYNFIVDAIAYIYSFFKKIEVK